MPYRLSGFDYSRPFFYMVTLKRRPGLLPLSEIVAPGRCQMLPITRALLESIRTFHLQWPCVEPIECFTIMPDHVHLLIKIRPVEGPLSLPRIVWLLIRRLEAAAVACGAAGASPSQTPSGLPDKSLAPGRSAGLLFERDWHDWIVMKPGQLAAFTRYIRDNPARAWCRHLNRRYFTSPGTLAFAGRNWFSYGNPDLLSLPVLEPFRCSRSWTPDGLDWRTALARAQRLGPGGAGVRTFLSPCEKACGNAIHLAGGSLVFLSPEGFPERWPPTRAKEALCASGRMLFLSLYPPQAARPDHATLHRRCHEMGDILLAALAPQAAAS
jgi:REP element-mobilizing transposase RayT